MEKIDWKNLSFGYIKTDYNVRCYYRNGKWGEVEVSSEETIPMHMAAVCLHYGQEAFEGMKAYRCPDGHVRVFRTEENAARMQATAQGLVMPEVSTEMFNSMIDKVVRLNERFIPPYESGATLYIRPLLIGISAQVGVHPSLVLTSKEALPLILMSSLVSTTVLHLLVQDAIRWVVTMLLHCVLISGRMSKVTRVSSISMPRKRSTSTSVVQQTSSASRTIRTSLLRALASCLQ